MGINIGNDTLYVIGEPSVNYAKISKAIFKIIKE
jgi:hypothetical protein